MSGYLSREGIALLEHEASKRQPAPPRRENDTAFRREQTGTREAAHRLFTGNPRFRALSAEDAAPLLKVTEAAAADALDELVQDGALVLNRSMYALPLAGATKANRPSTRAQRPERPELTHAAARQRWERDQAVRDALPQAQRLPPADFEIAKAPAAARPPAMPPPVERACLNAKCGRTFAPRRNGGRPQLHCSSQCRTEALYENRRNPPAALPAQEEVPAGGREPSTCRICGEPIVGRARKSCPGKCQREYSRRWQLAHYYERKGDAEGAALAWQGADPRSSRAQTAPTALVEIGEALPVEQPSSDSPASNETEKQEEEHDPRSPEAMDRSYKVAKRKVQTVVSMLHPDAALSLLLELATDISQRRGKWSNSP